MRGMREGGKIDVERTSEMLKVSGTEKKSVDHDMGL